MSNEIDAYTRTCGTCGTAYQADDYDDPETAGPPWLQDECPICAGWNPRQTAFSPMMVAENVIHVVSIPWIGGLVRVPVHTGR